MKFVSLFLLHNKHGLVNILGMDCLLYCTVFFGNGGNSFTLKHFERGNQRVPELFLGKNSEAKLPIYCDLLKGTNSKAFWHLLDGEGNGLINVKWENKFDVETHKANIIINSADKVGFATIHFTNEVNSDSFDVLVVVQ